MSQPQNKQRANAKNTGRLTLVYGTVSGLDATTTSAKIKDASTGKDSPWLKVIQRGSKGNRDFSLPDLGDWGLGILTEESESGFYLDGYYPDSYEPPETDGDRRTVIFKDGTVCRYDRATNKLEIDVQGSTAQLELKTASDNRLAMSPEGVITVADGKGASMVMTNGTITFVGNLISFNALGMQWQLGNASGDANNRSWTWDFDGTDGNIINAVDFTIEGKTLTTIGAIDTDGDRLTTSGWN